MPPAPIRPGLLSVTFRAMSVGQVADLAADAQLSTVEWGGDVHVPPGDLATATAVRHLCDDRRLAVSAYGSYYRAGEDAADFAAVLDTAADRGLTVATEYHGGTLADTADSTAALLSAVPGLRTCWQPPVGMDPADAIAGLERIGDRLANVHVFHGWPDGAHRRPLADGSDRWPAYLRAAADGMADGAVRYASLEFVAGDDTAQFRRDAAALRGWLGDPA